MNEQGLKALENLGAELGAAKAENEKLRGLLRECAGQIDLLIEVYVEDDVEPEDIAISEQIKADIHAALSRQAEPQKSCKWTRNEDTGAYETACGVTWHLSDGGEPEEHGQYFCHHCGKQIDDEGGSHE